MKKVISVTLCIISLTCGSAFCDVTLSNIELRPAKSAFETKEPIQAILFSRTEEYGARLNLEPYDEFSLYVYPLGDPDNIVATKFLSRSDFPDVILPGRRVLLSVTDIESDEPLKPGVYVLVFSAAYHHAGLPYNLEAPFVVSNGRRPS